MISEIAALVALGFFTFVMVFAALKDVATLTISNRLVFTLAGAFIIFAPIAGFAVIDIGQALGTGILVLLGTFTLFSFGLIGGGDAKFAAATAIWLGPEGVLAFLVITMLIGAGLALGLIAFRKVPLPVSLSSQTWVSRLQAPKTGIPYALAMSPAALLVIPNTAWFTFIA